MSNNRIVDKDTGDVIFEMWVQGDEVVIDVYVDSSPEPYTFRMTATQAENFISLLELTLGEEVDKD